MSVAQPELASYPALQSPPLEIKLLTLCARSHHGSECRTEIGEILAANPDWEVFVRSVMQHGLTPLVYRALHSISPALVPTEILEAFGAHCADLAERNRAVTQEFLQLVALLQAHHIDPIIFKGPSLAQEVYGDISLRLFGDLDFLIEEAQLGKTRRLLLENGYSETAPFSPRRHRAILRNQGQWGLVSPKGTVVEPHWRFAFRNLSLDLDYSGIQSRTRHIDLLGQQVRVLGQEDLLLVLCVNGCKEEWWNLRQVCDVAETLRTFPALDWNKLTSLARKQGCERILNIGLILAWTLLEAPLPRGIRSKVENDHYAQRLAIRVVERLTKGNSTGLQNRKITSSRLMMRERLSDKLRYLVRTLFTPNSSHFEFVDLPDQLFFLYYLIKPLHDYVLLPPWQLSKWLRSL